MRNKILITIVCSIFLLGLVSSVGETNVSIQYGWSQKFQEKTSDTPDTEVSSCGVLFEKREFSKRTYGTDYVLFKTTADGGLLNE